MPKIHVPDHVAQAIEEENLQKEETKPKEEKTSSVEENTAYVDQAARVLDPTLLDKSILERMPQPTG